ncbi:MULTISPECIES: hypothetical protein [unclassified Salipiger]|uniref:hypothetical protein n=1 Tax=unclassified Salipiger TaxID=2640570 RepID=UPI0013BDD2BD|nr:MULTISPECIES: hypothetical protein [unclassified Salipiger]NDV49124.1 hypothetical protein [Salipiger sp. PrR003]NDW31382.1 hypothetical protein [Salipiger sp. PrR007]
MKRLALVLALPLVAAPAFAFQCLAGMSTIGAALDSGPKLSEADLAQVRQLRTEGERLHAAGEHQHSIDILAEAMPILGIK